MWLLSSRSSGVWEENGATHNRPQSLAKPHSHSTIHWSKVYITTVNPCLTKKLFSLTILGYRQLKVMSITSYKQTIDKIPCDSTKWVSHSQMQKWERASTSARIPFIGPPVRWLMASQVQLVTLSAPEGKLGEGQRRERENKPYAPAGHETDWVKYEKTQRRCREGWDRTERVVVVPMVSI